MRTLVLPLITLMFGCAIGAGPQLRGNPPTAGRTTVYASGELIDVFSFDPVTGRLIKQPPVAAGRSPTYLAWDLSRHFLYALNETSPGRVMAFRIQGPNGDLTLVNEVATVGNGPAYLSVHPSGKWIFVAHFVSGDVEILPVKADGSVGPARTHQHPGLGAHMTVLDRTGDHLFVPCRDANLVAQYRFDPATGALTPANPPTVVAAAGAGPRHLAFHPWLNAAYLLNETDGTVVSFAYDPAAGTLSHPVILSSVPPGADEHAAAHILVHPGGKFVYTSNRNQNSLGIFAVDVATGRLTSQGFATAEGAIRTPRDFTVDPSGQFLLVANLGNSTITTLRIGPNGSLTTLGTVATSKPASFIGAVTLP